MSRKSGLASRYKVIPERLIKLRLEMGWTQGELCEVLNEKKPDTINPDGTREGKRLQFSAASAWETGRRPVPEDYVPVLAQVFGVTQGYLYGFTDDPNEEADEPKQYDDPDRRIEVPFDSLYKFHNMPIYVVFPYHDHEDAWSIYDDDLKRFVFRTYVLRLTKQNASRMKFYRDAPTFENNSPNWTKTTLSMKEMLSAKRVYISMINSDQAIKAKYDGWYRHNEDGTYLIKAGTGLVLPYEGLNITFAAYANNV